MKTKTKSIVVILLTLFIGILLGFLLHSNIMKMRYEQMSELRKPGGLINRMESIIDLSEEQKANIEPILKKHENRFRLFRSEAVSQLDSMRREIKQFLTEDQIKELESFFMNRGDFPPHGFKPKFPKERRR